MKEGRMVKLYAALVGRVDDTITYLEEMTRQKTFDWSHTMQATEMLKTALLEAEEQYIAAEEEAP